MLKLYKFVDIYNYLKVHFFAKLNRKEYVAYQINRIVLILLKNTINNLLLRLTFSSNDK